jgi:hypothetical protein
MSNYIELTKSQKKLVRALIDTGIKREKENCLLEAEAILVKWKSESIDSLEAYRNMYQCIAQKDREIARKYNDLKGSMYYITLINLILDKWITDDDLHNLDANLILQISKAIDTYTISI